MAPMSIIMSNFCRGRPCWPNIRTVGSWSRFISFCCREKIDACLMLMKTKFIVYIPNEIRFSQVSVIYGLCTVCYVFHAGFGAAKAPLSWLMDGPSSATTRQVHWLLYPSDPSSRPFSTSHVLGSGGSPGMWSERNLFVGEWSVPHNKERGNSEVSYRWWESYLKKQVFASKLRSFNSVI